MFRRRCGFTTLIGVRYINRSIETAWKGLAVSLHATQSVPTNKHVRTPASVDYLLGV
jgi:hypothetical protein